jgi:predicted transcriptional regulator
MSENHYKEFKLLLNSKRRGRVIIIAEILKYMKNGNTGKTRIMYKANLGYKIFQNYLSEMQKARLIQKSTDGKREIYKPTEKGSRFLEKYDELMELLCGPDSNNGKALVYVNNRVLVKK